MIPFCWVHSWRVISASSCIFHPELNLMSRARHQKKLEQYYLHKFSGTFQTWWSTLYIYAVWCAAVFCHRENTLSKSTRDMATLFWLGALLQFSIISERFLQHSGSDSNGYTLIKKQIKLRHRWMDGWKPTGWEVWIQFRSNWVLGPSCGCWGWINPTNFEVVLSKQSSQGTWLRNCLWRRAAVRS